MLKLIRWNCFRELQIQILNTGSNTVINTVPSTSNQDIIPANNVTNTGLVLCDICNKACGLKRHKKTAHTNK